MSSHRRPRLASLPSTTQSHAATLASAAQVAVMGQERNLALMKNCTRNCRALALIRRQRSRQLPMLGSTDLGQTCTQLLSLAWCTPVYGTCPLTRAYTPLRRSLTSLVCFMGPGAAAWLRVKVGSPATRRLAYLGWQRRHRFHARRQATGAEASAIPGVFKNLWELDTIVDSLAAWRVKLGCSWQRTQAPQRRSAAFSLCQDHFRRNP